jgi:hypothetical protein
MRNALPVPALILALAAFIPHSPSVLAASAEDEKDGIAAKYPADKGIAGDPNVLFWDDFEREDLKRWDANEHGATTSLTRTPANVHSGKQAVEMTAVIPGSSGGGLIKWFTPGLDRVYARFYVKFAKESSYVHHFVHVVGGRDKWSGFGKAGLKPRGDDFFTTGIEPDGKWGRVPPPGVWHFYTYWPDMKASPDGKYWGNDFSPDRPIPVPKDRWVCVEMMVKCNAAGGKNDGEQAFWVDGKLAGRFGGFRWRTTSDLKINAFWLLYYLTPEALERCGVKNAAGRYTVWFDNVVVATKLIGPMGIRDSTRQGGARFTPPAEDEDLGR